jgi:hypothetical protein
LTAEDRVIVLAAAPISEGTAVAVADPKQTDALH